MKGLWLLAVLTGVVVLGGCAGTGGLPARQPGGTGSGTFGQFPAPSPGQCRTPAGPSGQPGAPAVLALVNQADRSAQAGHLDAAADTLERALRIDPRNARVWHRLAALRLAEGKNGEAQALAAKSNSLAGGDVAVQIANWRLIAQVRKQAGDGPGVRRALARVRALQGQ